MVEAKHVRSLWTKRLRVHVVWVQTNAQGGVLLIVCSYHSLTRGPPSVGATCEQAAFLWANLVKMRHSFQHRNQASAANSLPATVTCQMGLIQAVKASVIKINVVMQQEQSQVVARQCVNFRSLSRPILHNHLDCVALYEAIQFQRNATTCPVLLGTIDRIDSVIIVETGSTFLEILAGKHTNNRIAHVDGSAVQRLVRHIRHQHQTAMIEFRVSHLRLKSKTYI